MQFILDRDLPIPLSAQLRGLLEYGIACGELAAGDRLPSVRDMAETISVAPMTVAQVYRDLKEAGLIETRSGSGTFVAQRGLADSRTERRLGQFHRSVDKLIAQAFELGLSSNEIAGLIAARLSSRQSRGKLRQIVLVGIFPAATQDYARAIAATIGQDVTVFPTILTVLQDSVEVRQRAEAADLVLTIATRLREVSALLPQQRVLAIRFIPSEATRGALAALDPLARVLCVSKFPEFVAIMKPGVQRFAPHVRTVSATVLGADNLSTLIADHNVIVFATGAEAAVDTLSRQQHAIEYRHMPDPLDIERLVRPLISSANGGADGDPAKQESTVQ